MDCKRGDVVKILRIRPDDRGGLVEVGNIGVVGGVARVGRWPIQVVVEGKGLIHCREEYLGLIKEGDEVSLPSFGDYTNLGSMGHPFELGK